MSAMVCKNFKLKQYVQVKAAEIVPSEDFAFGHTLRFPRAVVHIREDKDRCHTISRKYLTAPGIAQQSNGSLRKHNHEGVRRCRKIPAKHYKVRP
eukprot:6468724-Amphidinium_carterae.1